MQEDRRTIIDRRTKLFLDNKNIRTKLFFRQKNKRTNYFLDKKDIRTKNYFTSFRTRQMLGRFLSVLRDDIADFVVWPEWTMYNVASAKDASW